MKEGILFFGTLVLIALILIFFGAYMILKLLKKIN